MGKSLAFIKSAIDQKSLKPGVVTASTINIVQKKKFHCHSNMSSGIKFFGPYFAKGLIEVRSYTA